MANFSVRVELHDATAEHYALLHDQMDRKGFVRWVSGGDGVKYALPTAEYNLLGSKLDRAGVLHLAKSAANAVKPRPEPSILVTESAGRTWSGLKNWVAPGWKRGVEGEWRVE